MPHRPAWSSLVPGDVGARVVVRHRLHDRSSTARASDVIGELVEYDDDTLVVRPQRSPDSPVRLPWADVVAAKRIPKRRVTRRDVRRVEAAAAGGWVADETAWVSTPGGWLLRAAGGFTSRANSCLPLANPGMRLDQAVDDVIAWYRARDLPPSFVLPTLLGSDLATHLDARGWPAQSDEVLVLTGDIDDVADVADNRAADATVALAAEPSSQWLQAYRYRGAWPPAAAQDVLQRGRQLRFASIHDGDTLVAMGRGALSTDPNGTIWLGLTALEVTPEYRRAGLGRAVVLALAHWARQAGCGAAYLQVGADNTAAIATYEGLGFGEHHRYTYRRLD